MIRSQFVSVCPRVWAIQLPPKGSGAGPPSPHLNLVEALALLE